MFVGPPVAWPGCSPSLPHVADAEEVYQKLMRGIDRLAVEVTARTQRGSLPIYLGVILLVLVAAARRGAAVRPGLARGADAG